MTKIILGGSVGCGCSESYLNWLLNEEDGKKEFKNIAQAINCLEDHGFNPCEIACFQFIEIKEN